MIKAEIKTEITITNEEIAEFLLKDGSVIDTINETFIDMLFDKYKMSSGAGWSVIDDLTMLDYANILKILADKMVKEG